MRFVAPAGTKLVGRLGAGTMFDAARVEHEGRVVACKRLLPRMREEPAARAAMAREASALASASHGAIPALYGVGTDDAGPFVLEELVVGLSLRELAEAWRARGAAVPEALFAHVATAAATSLAELHELTRDGAPLGLSHGDLGPDHLRFDPSGAVRFVDFGAARFAGMAEALVSSDKGTLPFVAPEVARGDVAPDQAADVYALAATLHFLANGEPLLAVRDEAAILLAIGERGLPLELADRAEGLGPRGRDALRRAIAKDRAARLTSARELARELART